MNKSLFVVLGATGDLANKKIFPSLKDIENIKIVTYSRRKPESNYESIIGDFDDLTPLFKYINDNGYKDIYFYFAVPPTLYLSLIDKIFAGIKNKNIKIALEKPFGTSHKEAKILASNIKKYGESNFYLVDHYAAKEKVIDFIENRNKIITKEIEAIEISISEIERLEKRGSFFDNVGIINDTVQNHILLLARIILGKQIDEINFKLDSKSIKFDQFEGYKNIEGVRPDSKTPTSFKGEFIHEDITIKIFSAKAQTNNSKNITVYFKDKTKHVINIDESSQNGKLPHNHIINDFVSNKNLYSVSISDSMAQWRIVEQIKDYS